jgi:flagellar hook-associated protein 2
MAVSSTSSATGSSLDVASIVSQLMEVESQPLNKLDAKIGVSSVKISVLGQFKGQLSTLQAALRDLQTPSNFNALTAKVSSENIANAQLDNTAAAGSYQMEVEQLALPAIWHVSGFGNETAAMNWYNAASQSEIKSAADAVVFRTEANEYVLSLKAKSTGTVASFDLDGVANAVKDQEAQDARFKLNGIDFVRASNTVTDVLSGVTLSLKAETDAPVTLTIAQAASSARPKLDALVKAYNDLHSFYKTQTQSSSDTATRGILNSDFAIGSMMRELLNSLMLPLTGSDGQSLPGSTDLSALGIELKDNGQLAVNDALFNAASSTLQSRLASGLVIGYNATSSSDLSTRITEMFSSGGVLQERIDNEQQVQNDLNDRKTVLQDKLAGVQARYIAQYAALDALLFKLNSTSNSLKSALDGLTASQKNN